MLYTTDLAAPAHARRSRHPWSTGTTRQSSFLVSHVLHYVGPVGGRVKPRMATRVARLVVALALTLGAALSSPAAAAVVRLPTSQEIAASSVPARGAEPAYARSYFGARYYRAGIGRFTTVDPELNVKDALVEPQRWNRYAYVTNNPLRYTDPDGKNPLLIAGGIGAAVYGGWAIYQNVSHGQPWYNNVGVEATKGLMVGLTLGLAAPAVAGMGAAETALAGSATGTSTVVIGSYPRYLELARELGAKSFSIPAGVREKMSEAEKLAANDKFLDRAVSRTQTFVVTMDVTDALKSGTLDHHAGR